MIHTGMRPSETRALTWNDIDFTTGNIHITKGIKYVPGVGMYLDETKTDGSTRTLELNPNSEVFLVFAGMRTKRAEDLLAVGEKINGDSYIFSHIDGTPWGDTKTGNGLRKAIQDSGVDMKNDWRLLRHLHATISLLIGEPIHDVSRRLGHANIQITLMHYADIISSSQRSASDNLSKVLEQVEVMS